MRFVFAPSKLLMSSPNLDESSETEAGLGRIDNSEVALAALESRNLEKLIEALNERPDFHERAVVKQYRFPDTASVIAASEKPASETSSIRSLQTSMAVCTSYALSNRTPSLGSYPSIKSSSSARTSRANSFLRPIVLEQDESGTPQAPTAQDTEGRLACCFSYLKCHYRSDNLEEWDMHCQSHFHGILPKEVHCPFECNWTRLEASGAEAWRHRILHIVAKHPNDELNAVRRPKASLIDHLWRHRIIDDVQKKELVRHGRLTGDISISSSGPVQHNRIHRRQIRAGA